MIVEPQPIRHPEWCQPARCTATPQHHAGEMHRGYPVTVADKGINRFVLTARLFQAHARWLTDTLGELEVSGLAEDWEPVCGTAIVPVAVVLSLGTALVQLADVGPEQQERQSRERLKVGTDAT